MLNMTEIVKCYGPTLVLDGVSLAVKAGEVMALMGENGAGKSTLVKILAGIEPCDSGVIEISGKPVAIRSPEDARSAGVGYVAQELSVIDSLSVAENVFLGDRSCDPRPSWRNRPDRILRVSGWTMSIPWRWPRTIRWPSVS